MVASNGCRRAAYNELYIEQLNSDARLLEDRIYEYDAAYRQLELELSAVQQENARLRGELSNPNQVACELNPLRSSKSIG